MKRIVFIVAVIFLATIVVSAQQKAQQFGVKSGTVTYELTGNTTGTKTVSWDNYGTKTHTEIKSKTVTKMFGMTSEDEAHTIMVIVEDKYWSADLIDESGTKGTLPYYNEAKDYAESMSEQEQKELADEILNSMGGERLGTESVMGYSCDVISIMGAKSWIYKGIILKSEANIMGITSNELATTFNPNASVSSSKFSPYNGVEYTDLSEMTQQSGGNPFAQMGMAMEMSMEEETDYEEEVVPVSYSYEKFKSVINGFSYADYSFKGTNSFDGQYAAVYAKGYVNMITIVATARENADKDDTDNFETFTHKGKTCHYGAMDDEEGTALIIDYPSDDMYIIIVASPDKDKQTLLSIHDELDF